MSAVSTFFSRFTVKFIEVVGAGVATALTGYLLAHFGGYFNAQSSVPVPPPVVQAAPGSGVPGSGAPNATVVSKSQRAQPAAASADAKEPRRPQPAEVAIPASLQSERATVGSVPSSSTHRRVPPEPAAAETRAREAESVEARIRAALANVDASHQPASEMPARPTDAVTAAPKVSNSGHDRTRRGDRARRCGAGHRRPAAGCRSSSRGYRTRSRARASAAQPRCRCRVRPTAGDATGHVGTAACGRSKVSAGGLRRSVPRSARFDRPRGCQRGGAGHFLRDQENSRLFARRNARSGLRGQSAASAASGRRVGIPAFIAGCAPDRPAALLSPVWCPQASRAAARRRALEVADSATKTAFARFTSLIGPAGCI